MSSTTNWYTANVCFIDPDIVTKSVKAEYKSCHL